MTHRILYIAAYDISDPGRLRDGLKVLKGYASGRQKSVFECFLTPAERAELLAQMRGVIDEEEDRFFLIRLDDGARRVGQYRRRDAHRRASTWWRWTMPIARRRKSTVSP